MGLHKSFAGRTRSSGYVFMNLAIAFLATVFRGKPVYRIVLDTGRRLKLQDGNWDRPFVGCYRFTVENANTHEYLKHI
jgi:hypothetical protein